MNKSIQSYIREFLFLSLLAGISFSTLPAFGQEGGSSTEANRIASEVDDSSIVQPVQWLGGFQSCGESCGSGGCGGDCGAYGCDGGGKSLVGVDQFSGGCHGRESGWANAGSVPWEAFGYGEYIGPHRAPHVGEYRLRVNDQLEFVYLLTREKSLEPYQLYVGDVIQISSAIDSSLSQEDITILSDGTISLSLIGRVRVAGKTVSDLQRELNDKYTKYVKNPAIVVQVTESDTPLRDLIQSVDATAGQGGQVRQATVSPDGTVQLPLVGSVPAIGLTLGEIGREINARYRLKLRGVEVTPILIERAARFVYVVGEVDQPGRFEMVGPTSAMQAVALAGGFEQGGNLRQIIVFRRDQNWRLTATKLDLNGALLGKKPHPSDEIWLRDSDIVLIPKRPIQRFSEAVNLYLASTLYAIFPQQGVAFNFDDFTSL
jgi:polysaccharide export outer membrane protein